MTGARARALGPLRIRAASRQDAVREIVGAIGAGSSARVAFANTHLLYCAYRDPTLARELDAFNVYNDGLGVDIISIAAGAGRFPDNLNGTDLVPAVLRACPEGTRVYLIGARSRVAAAAAHKMQALWPHVAICGVSSGYGDPREAREHIRATQPDLVLVAMGNPLQERFIAACADDTPAVYIGVGALFDFLSGAVPRAPEAWRRARLEWLHRLLLDPARMWRRYGVEPLIVLFSVCASRLQRQP